MYVPTTVPTPPPLSHAHHAPPQRIREVHKRYQKAPVASLPEDEFLLDFGRDRVSGYHKTRLKTTTRISRARVEQVCRDFEERKTQEGAQSGGDSLENDILVYEHSSVPGLRIVPSILPPSTQKALLNRLLFRDLSNLEHKTNLNLHYNLPYDFLSASSSGPPSSFFDIPRTTLLEPLDPETHKPLSIEKMLEKKLRWMTLGGQYDWTRKEYPEKQKGEEVLFPQDVEKLITGMFPGIITPQAAICNLYSPGDTLSPHRDVSESSTAALFSLSIGCDALFIIGLDDSSEVLAMRIRSGDVVIMDNESRWAWHSVPRILAGTCPEWLVDWPTGKEGRWMGRKRINLNVRQMWD